MDGYTILEKAQENQKQFISNINGRVKERDKSEEQKSAIKILRITRKSYETV